MSPTPETRKYLLTEHSRKTICIMDQTSAFEQELHALESKLYNDLSVADQERKIKDLGERAFRLATYQGKLEVSKKLLDDVKSVQTPSAQAKDSFDMIVKQLAAQIELDQASFAEVKKSDATTRKILVAHAKEIQELKAKNEMLECRVFELERQNRTVYTPSEAW